MMIATRLTLLRRSKALLGAFLIPGLLLSLPSNHAVAAGQKTKSISAAEVSPETIQLYKDNCGDCHGANRTGAMGPALLPENLSRLRMKKAVDVIKNGRAATQMPAFSQQLDDKQISALASYVFSKPDVAPTWTEKDIQASHIVYHSKGTLPDKPKFEADLKNLFIVVELEDHSATLLNGDTFEPINRFKTRFALHGGPKYSPDGRYVYFASRDGWVSKYDIYNMTFVAEIRAAINTRNLAISKDGKYAMVANYLPQTLVLLDTADLKPVKVFNVTSDQGQPSRVSAVYTAPPRNSFIAALKDLKEVWEIPYDQPELNVRKITVDDYLDDFFFDQSYKHLIGASRDSKDGQVIDLDLGKKIKTIDLAGMPHLGSGITWEYKGRTVMATPNLKDGQVSVIDMNTWEVIKRIETKGPGFFMRSHSNSKYAWVDVFFGPNKDLMHVINKETLEIEKTLQPIPGKTAAHIEFTKDGSHALMSIWDKDGALIVYDADTLEEVKRLPMKKPSGKYNVHNKTTYASGTSH
ncbi:cytochrome D1 domain-containing protein [Alkalimarinus sediminis]|uniref:Nitrite reductase n=1 Tax=Alkalimarinus sediminis TaxID=1632866 RepID=A0A9E8HNB2_9ALTE|nr:cytochrome D1 domain-containing protein [Alkalimarinus sediminis]UZW75738.1 nitrite reductase [Alkalimarinus sediminis]